jgi:hypothetical protein
MPFPTIVTCVYKGYATGIKLTDLHDAVVAVTLDSDMLNLWGLTVDVDNIVSDTATQTVTRTIQLFLNDPEIVDPFGRNTTTARKPFTGTIRSRSENDQPTGPGAHTVTVNYLDHTGAPDSETVTLNGRTAVNMTKANKTVITSIVLVSVGSDEANDGDILPADDDGLVMCYLPQSFYSHFRPVGNVNAFSLGAWMKKRFQGVMAMPIAATLPITFS